MDMVFSEPWMAAYKDAWNAEPALAGTLARVSFSSRIGYGFVGEKAPVGVLLVDNGAVTEAGLYQGEDLDWDLRATRETWSSWLASPPGMLALGAAYTSGNLQFVAGDYASMIKDPRLASPFVKSFQVMSKIVVGAAPAKKGQ